MKNITVTLFKKVQDIRRLVQQLLFFSACCCHNLTAVGRAAMYSFFFFSLSFLVDISLTVCLDHSSGEGGRVHKTSGGGAVPRCKCVTPLRLMSCTWWDYYEGCFRGDLCIFSECLKDNFQCPVSYSEIGSDCFNFFFFCLTVLFLCSDERDISVWDWWYSLHVYIRYLAFLHVFNRLNFLIDLFDMCLVYKFMWMV